MTYSLNFKSEFYNLFDAILYLNFVTLNYFIILLLIINYFLLSHLVIVNYIFPFNLSIVYSLKISKSFIKYH